VFNVIGGLLGHTEGNVSVAGEAINGPHKSIGMVFQEESTFPWRSVTDNVAFPLCDQTGQWRVVAKNKVHFSLKAAGKPLSATAKRGAFGTDVVKNSIRKGEKDIH